MRIYNTLTREKEGMEKLYQLGYKDGKKIEEFFDRLDRNYSLPEFKDNRTYKSGDKLLLIDIADLHLNLQASMFTTGNEYNCDI